MPKEVARDSKISIIIISTILALAGISILSLFYVSLTGKSFYESYSGRIIAQELEQTQAESELGGEGEFFSGLATEQQGILEEYQRTRSQTALNQLLSMSGGLVTFEGELEVIIYDDFKNAVSMTEYYLNAQSGEELLLIFSGDDPPLMTGSKVRVTGNRIGNVLIIIDIENNFEVLYEAQTGHTVKKLAVILFRFTDTTEYSFNPQLEYVRKSMFDEEPFIRTFRYKSWIDQHNYINISYNTTYPTTNSFLIESSYGNLRLAGKLNSSGDVFGIYNISSSSSGCNWLRWINQAKNAARQNGVNLNGYNHLMFIAPEGRSNCWFSGIAYIGGSISFIRDGSPDSGSTGVPAHELGHNFGLAHANSYECRIEGNYVALADFSKCRSIEYGDIFDTMGDAYSFHHFSSFNRGTVNWFSASNTLMLDSPYKKTYTIEMLENPSNNPKTLMIPVKERGGLSHRDYYSHFFVEYRRPYGYYDNFLDYEHVVKGASIRLATIYHPIIRTNLIDTNPSAPATTNRFSDAALLPGQIIVDPVSGVKIKTISADPTSLVVEVDPGYFGSCGDNICMTNRDILKAGRSKNVIFNGSIWKVTLAGIGPNEARVSVAVDPFPSYSFTETIPLGQTKVIDGLPIKARSIFQNTRQVDLVFGENNNLCQVDCLSP
ncbi:MAG TPA: hypothetical protein HA282_04460 [Nanoarchaeota archaeon]|nr:hypothetical protein [Candidatus Pacearchaeota archaeon]HIH34508.1 hypothetical protein [Nanoarchaeota archaeon]HIH51519.1 hypothetical protein [Nanoarchaeota archaeon]HIH66437.1 hypothetical protein [Nanoarchaeota archaeon]